MTIVEIQELIEAHAVAAAHAEQAGADGFEFPINAGGGLQSFTSEFYNQRSDRYGGSLENRMRIVTEIIAAIRERVRSDFAIGVAVTPDESNQGPRSIELGTAHV